MNFKYDAETRSIKLIGIDNAIVATMATFAAIGLRDELNVAIAEAESHYQRMTSTNKGRYLGECRINNGTIEQWDTFAWNVVPSLSNEVNKPSEDVPEMVQRVAIAFSIVEGVRSYDQLLNNGKPWWTLYIKHAKACIEAMRQPTDEMIKAIHNTYMDMYVASGEIVLISGNVCNKIWDKTINAALGIKNE